VALVSFVPEHEVVRCDRAVHSKWEEGESCVLSSAGGESEWM
jgi:hypothetical protein